MIDELISTTKKTLNLFFVDDLLHLVKTSSWNELKNKPVSVGLDKKIFSIFSENIWHFPQYNVGTEYDSLNFNSDPDDISFQFKNEIKSVVLAYLYYSTESYRIGSLITKLATLKRLAHSLMKINVNSFDGLTVQQLKDMTKKGIYSPREIDMGVLNSLNYLDEYLPFSVNYSQRITMKLLKAKTKKTVQHPVIPFRIYMSALNEFSKEINDWYDYRYELEHLIKSCMECKSFSSIKINNKLFKSKQEVKIFCKELDQKCRYLILCLSGMRSNELIQIKPEFGAQVVLIDGIEVHIFHTKQQKITVGYQGENDVFVTTPTGHRAYFLLNALNKPARQWHTERNMKCWFLNSYNNFKKPRSIQKSKNILNSLIRLFGDCPHSFSTELDSRDLEMLRRSDPERSFSNGENWHLTPHQLRRSLAYYLVGMQLADYPQLKQQLSHYSIAMTMYYARNSSSFAKMYRDLEQERTRQQGQLYSALITKAQQGTKFGGGKGRNLFKESLDGRDITAKFYEKEIKQGKKHIHALFPGIYCVNKLCNMRAKIDLSETVDCAWAVIESSAYIQAARQESINIMEALNQTNELSPDIISFHTNRIRAAEKIMTDMDINFKSFTLSQLCLATAS